MPVYATRKIRNLTAALMLLSGLTHIGQLWFVKLGPDVVMAAVMGMFYLLIGLGLSGQSRFTLWIASTLPAAGAAFGIERLLDNIHQPLLLWHVCADTLVVIMSIYILIRTRNSDMD